MLLFTSLFMVFWGIHGDWQFQQESKTDGALNHPVKKREILLENILRNK